jgi:hypothetical protein
VRKGEKKQGRIYRKGGRKDVLQKEGQKVIRKDRRINARNEGYKDVNMEVMMYKKERKQGRAKVARMNRTREGGMEGVKAEKGRAHGGMYLE